VQATMTELTAKEQEAIQAEELAAMERAGTTHGGEMVGSKTTMEGTERLPGSPAKSPARTVTSTSPQTVVRMNRLKLRPHIGNGRFQRMNDDAQIEADGDVELQEPADCSDGRPLAEGDDPASKGPDITMGSKHTPRVKAAEKRPDGVARSALEQDTRPTRTCAKGFVVGTLLWVSLCANLASVWFLVGETGPCLAAALPENVTSCACPIDRTVETLANRSPLVDDAVRSQQPRLQCHSAMHA